MSTAARAPRGSVRSIPSVDSAPEADDGGALRPVKSAERALRLLEILGGEREPVAVAELHRRTGYPRSSLHQLLHTIAAQGWIEMSPDGGSASIGSRALIVGTSYLDRDRALPYAGATLERVRDETGYTAHYARLDGADVLYLATRETTHSRRATSRVGRHLPANATALGKAMLAELTPAERRDRLGGEPLRRLTARTLTTHADLDLDLETVRDRHYAVEREENTAGVSCVSATVGYRIPATDAMSCSLPLDVATEDEVDRVGRILRAHADELARTLRSAGIR